MVLNRQELGFKKCSLKEEKVACHLVLIAESGDFVFFILQNLRTNQSRRSANKKIYLWMY